jgi:hypothetical protein
MKYIKPFEISTCSIDIKNLLKYNYGNYKNSGQQSLKIYIKNRKNRKF